ncbi:MAG: PepSY domain-containing protein [Aquabacterium sp.]|uniref:PepSY domain-containing protein n=1 Tax=Aquabacterium sp. TaxID=1872578 RepID=UPI0025C18564|nr:PepSY domain-containing protein [Aquabacterium sp.]MBI3384240.1 PepSY domain-containing protein [Aquabacterium sp.]
MKHLTATLVLGLAALPLTALASANCPAHPKSEWVKEGDARAKLEEQGYKIRKFKVEGQCYEIYGWNKDGKKVEIYFDTKTLDIVKAEIEK